VNKIQNLSIKQWRYGWTDVLFVLPSRALIPWEDIECIRHMSGFIMFRGNRDILDNLNFDLHNLSCII